MGLAEGLEIYVALRLASRARLDLPHSSDRAIKGVTPHVLRHTFGSVAGDMGFSELTIKALLGHGARGSTQNYVHIDEALRLAVERVSSKIEQLLRRETAVILDWAA